MKTISKISLVCALVVAASGACAQKAGDNIVSFGLASINPDTKVGQLTNSAGGAAQIAVNGATAQVSSETTLALSWLRMYSDNFGAELTLGLPPTMTQDLTTPATGPHPAAAKIQLRAPAVLAKYFFGGAQDQWRPYLGLGVAHVSFHKIRTNANDSTIQNLSGNGASLSSTWTPVYNAGLVYKIDEKWSISSSVSYLPVKTTATFVGRTGYGTTTGDVKLNTTDYVVRVGYNF